MKPKNSPQPNASEKTQKKPQPITGEGMVDSMSETAPDNDKTRIPEAEQLTDENGKLDAEKFKRSYQQNPDDQMKDRKSQ